MENTLYYSLSDVSLSQFIVNDALLIKGTNTLTLNLTGLVEDEHDIIFLRLIWGDGTVASYQKPVVYDYKNNSIFDEILYGKIGGSVATVYEHTYINNTTSYNVALTAQFVAIYRNGTVVNFLQPIYIVSDSFYDRIDNIKLLSSQILPNSSSNTVISIESDFNKQTYLGVLSGSDITLDLPSFEPDDGYVFVFTSDNEQVFDHNGNAVQVDEILANS
jgi:hypothetical protein